MAMVKYGDLNLRKIMDDTGIDFAHFTYESGMCSCCYGPVDMNARHWAGAKMKDREERKETAKKTGEYSYILFKNADNGSGAVSRNDYVCSSYHRGKIRSPWFTDPTIQVAVEWSLTEDQLDKVCTMLQEQLGSDYVVDKPESDSRCILIDYTGEPYIPNK